MFLDLRKNDIMKKTTSPSKRPKMTVSKYVNRNIGKKLQDKSVLYRYKGKLYFLKEAETGIGVANWADSRGYIQYNDDYKMLFIKKNQYSMERENLLECLFKKYKENKKTLQVLDDGAGKGNFLAELKKMLINLKIPCNTTAVSFSDRISEKNKPIIDNVILGDALNLDINKKYDLITSFYGSIHYSMPELRDEIMKKYIFSLNKKGIAIFRFSEFKKEPGAKSLEWMRLLEKVGFSVTEIIENPKENITNHIMLIQRLK